MYTYKLGGIFITDELYHDDLEAMTFGRKDQNELRHSGIKGMSWGKRRFQNEDGSLTAAGRNRYGVGDPMKGVSAYSDTGGRGGSGVSYTRLPSGSGGANRTIGSSAARPAATRSTVSTVRPGVSQQMRNQTANKVVNIQQRVASSTNNGKKAADNLFSRIGNWATNAANDVGKAATNAYNGASRAVNDAADWVGDRAQDVSKAATNAYNDASKWVEDRAKDVGNAVTNTAANLSNTPEYRDAANAVNDAKHLAGNAANDIGKTAQNAAKDAGNWLGNAFNDAKNWVGDRAQDVGNFANNAYNDASKAVTNAAQDVGNFVKNAPQNISDWYTGDKAGREAQRYDNVVQNFERNGDQNINAGQDIISRGLKYPESAYDLESGQSMRDKTVIEGLDRRNLGYDQHDIARQYGQKADEAQARYDAAPRQLLERAGNWIGDRAQDVGRAAANAYSDASKAVGNAAKDVGDWASNAASDVRDWGAGALDKGRQAFESLFGRSEAPKAELSDPNSIVIPENIIREQIIPEQRITENRIEEQKIPEQRIEEQRIPEAIVREGEKYAQMTPDQRQARMDSQKNRPTVNGSNNVQTWDNANINTWDNVQTFGDPDMVNTIKMLNDNGFFNRGGSSNSGNNSSMSDKPSNVSDEYWRDYTSNGGTRESYDRQMQARQNSYNDFQREQIRKGTLSDKPDNVSDDFWEEYKSNGGTREGFDRTFKQGLKEGLYKEDEYFDSKPLTGESLFGRIDYDDIQKRMNDTISSQNGNFASTSIVSGNNTVDTSRPYHFTYDPASGQTIVVYDDEKRR